MSLRSLDRLSGVHPDLVAVVKLAIQRTAVDFTVVEGLRTAERQRELVAQGASQTQNSYHLKQTDGYGHAVDLAPLVGGAIPWDDWAQFRALAETVKECAAELGVPVEWGGDWKTFKDGPHFQIPRNWKVQP
ncbi:M15 family metallopeptidase [Achromobacter dolens]|uniref:M15 family metallopeptidase n=1 Tax=Achromobacter dolens TaxID=1287738 RepID=UPI003556678A